MVQINDENYLEVNFEIPKTEQYDTYMEILSKLPNLLTKYDKIKKNVHEIIDNYKVKLATPGIPVFAWKPMVFVIVTVVAFYGWKYFNTI